MKNRVGDASDGVFCSTVLPVLVLIPILFVMTILEVLGVV